MNHATAGNEILNFYHSYRLLSCPPRSADFILSQFACFSSPIHDGDSGYCQDVQSIALTNCFARFVAGFHGDLYVTRIGRDAGN